VCEGGKLRCRENGSETGSGTLSTNGKVFLINPNGVLFAPGSSVNVGGLVASTLNISDSDFLNGNYVFANNGSAGGVTNQGTINAANEAVLIGPQVKNEGVIAAQVTGLTAGNTGDVIVAQSGSGSNYNIGGLVGSNVQGSIAQCYNLGKVSVGLNGDGYNTSIGGLVGENDGNNGSATISNSYNSGTVSVGVDISGNYSIGGLVGHNYDDGGHANIWYSYSSGVVVVTRVIGIYPVGTNQYVGRLVGLNNGTIISSYWNSDSAGTLDGIGSGDATGIGSLTTAQMKNSDNFIGWDFNTIWGIKAGQSYPYLFNPGIVVVNPTNNNPTSPINNTYQETVSAAQQLDFRFKNITGKTGSEMTNGQKIVLINEGSNTADLNSGSSAIASSGFHVAEISYVNSQSEQGLILNHGMLDVVVQSQNTVAIVVPVDTFVTTDSNTTVQLSATLANGQSLPDWLHFDDYTGTFIGMPPVGLTGAVDIKVMARDIKGTEAVTTFKLIIGESDVQGKR